MSTRADLTSATGVESKPQQARLGRLIDALSADGLLSEDYARLALVVGQGASKQRQHPLVAIAERNWPDARDPQRTLTLDLLCQWLAQREGLEFCRIDPLKIDARAVTAVMSYAYAVRFNILALEVGADEVVIACADHGEAEWVAELRHVLGKRIRRVIASPEDIGRYLTEFYTLSRSVIGAEREQRDGGPVGSVQNLEQLMELGRAGKLDANDSHVVSIVDWLLQYAFEQRSSDIHLEPRREQSQVRFRIDGVLHTVYQMPTPVMAAVTSRVKILGRMDVAEKRRPQDGRLKTRNPDGQEVELRLSTMPTAFGEKLVMRIFDPEVLLKDYTALGFTSHERVQWQEMVQAPHGIILVTGPTGSGKTTTLYSTLRQLAQPEVNVCTIEDPIELIEPAFNQMQVQHNIGLDFASGVRTLLRQDPDIIMVGEIRDLETAEMATQAALTGHLVVASLHTNDAPSAITRLLELGLPHYLLNSTLLGVVAQRLVRTLCVHCREPVDTDAEAWEQFVSPWKSQPPLRLHQPVGCLECRNTGYRGRTGLYELFRMTPTLAQRVTAETDLIALRQQALREGMRPLRISGAQKVAAGLTTIGEVQRVTPPGQRNG